MNGRIVSVRQRSGSNGRRERFRGLVGLGRGRGMVLEGEGAEGWEVEVAVLR